MLHWNSPLKINVKTKHSDFFKKLYLIFVESDGNLLRREVFGCNNTNINVLKHQQLVKSLNKSDVCYDFRRAEVNVYRTHLYYVTYKYSPEENDVTLVSQLSIDRLYMIEYLANRWKGPISLALYISDSEVQQFLNFITKSSILSSRTNIGYHVVYREEKFYPINHLRNIALESVNTSYVFLVDIDLIPNPRLYTYLKQMLATVKHESKKAFVVPAFESLLYRIDLPSNKAELIKLLDLGMITSFRYQIWPQGHRPTDYQKWRTATTPYM